MESDEVILEFMWVHKKKVISRVSRDWYGEEKSIH